MNDTQTGHRQPVSRRLIPLAALLTLLLPLAASPAAAQGVEIAEVRIYARNIDTGEDIAWVNPGQSLQLPQAVKVRLRIEAIPRNAGPRYPSAAYAVSQSGRPTVSIERTNTEMGSATLQTFGRSGRTVIRYKILDNGLRMPDALRNGSFGVDVQNAASAPTQQPPASQQNNAFQMVDELFQGILLRRAPVQGTEEFVRRIQRGGYTEAIAVAVDIANSPESQRDIYQRGVRPEERLTALYAHLLGVRPEDVDRDQRQADLDAISRGDIDRLVGGLVRSDDFRERFGYRDERGVRRRY